MQNRSNPTEVIFTQHAFDIVVIYVFMRECTCMFIICVNLLTLPRSRWPVFVDVCGCNSSPGLVFLFFFIFFPSSKGIIDDA